MSLFAGLCLFVIRVSGTPRAVPSGSRNHKPKDILCSVDRMRAADRTRHLAAYAHEYWSSRARRETKSISLFFLDWLIVIALKN